MTYCCTSCGKTSTLPYGGIVIDWIGKRVTRGRISTFATHGELLALKLLIEKSGDYATTEELEIATDHGVARSGNIVAVNISRLRYSLKPLGLSIIARRNQGYCLKVTP